MPPTWAQTIPAEVQGWAGIALLVLFFAAIGFYAAFARWMRHRYGPHRLEKPRGSDSAAPPEPDAWTESARRLDLSGGPHDPPEQRQEP